jgi:hypothetical protein
MGANGQRAAETEFSWDTIAEKTEYQKACEDMICNIVTKHSPWYVVPADNKWFTRVVVAAAIIDTIASLDVDYPEVDKAKLQEIATAKTELFRLLQFLRTSRMRVSQSHYAPANTLAE